MESVLSTLTITKTICDTISAIRNGPDLVRKTAEIVLQFHGLLERIQKLHVHGNQPIDSTNVEYAGLVNAVKASEADVRDFAAKLQSLQLTHGQKVAGRVWNRLKTVVSEKDLEAITTKISHHNGNISTHLEVINSKIIMDVKAMAVDTTSAIRRLEHASATHTETASQYDEEIKSRLDANTAIFTQSVSVSNSQAGAMQDALAQILQLLQQQSTAQASEASGILGEVVGDGEEPMQDGTPSRADPVEGVDKNLRESIERLGQLVQEKERTYDTLFDDEDTCASIIEDLGNILSEAKKKTKSLSENAERLCCSRRYGNLAQSIARFNKVHGSNTMTINPRDQAAYRQKKRRRATDILEHDLSFEVIPLSTGSLTLKRRKLLLKCKCGESDCVHRQSRHSKPGVQDTDGLPMECLTTVAFTPYGQKNPYTLIASEYNFKNWATGSFKSISFLAVNPVLPATSRVFQIVENGDLQGLREMLQAGEASLRDTDVDGLSLLFYAVQQPNVMKYLLRHGLDVDHVGYRFGDILVHALQYDLNDFEMNSCELNRSHECRELLIAAGADPLACFQPLDTSPFLLTQATESQGRAAEHARRAISLGIISLRDVTEHAADQYGRNMLHRSCINAHDGSTKDNISAILDLGFDINAADGNGDTCLVAFSMRLGYRLYEEPPFAIREQEVLVFLLRAGANTDIILWNGLPIFKGVYECHESHRNICCCEQYSPHGSYCGDLWDSALSICGMDILEFRAGYQRRAKYTERYTREMFEALWRERETECPYWDDKPWPPVVTDTKDGCQCSNCTGDFHETPCSCQVCIDMGEAQSEEEYSVDGESDMDSEGHVFDEESDEQEIEDTGEDKYSDMDEDLSDY